MINLVFTKLLLKICVHHYQNCIQLWINIHDLLQLNLMDFQFLPYFCGQNCSLILIFILQNLKLLKECHLNLLLTNLLFFLQDCDVGWFQWILRIIMFNQFFTKLWFQICVHHYQSYKQQQMNIKVQQQLSFKRFQFWRNFYVQNCLIILIFILQNQ